MTDRAAPSPLDWALPADAAGWCALAVAAALVAALPWLKNRAPHVRASVWVCTCALAASMLSALYIEAYLRGGPRIIDATSYWLEARGFASGLLRWNVPEPTASFRGRFLLHTFEQDASSWLGVIFPPGYPAVLAVGFVVGIPMAVGPALAAALVVATWALAKIATNDEQVARVASLMSVLCACLRYHTADTMSHGLAAVCLAAATALGLLAYRSDDRSRARLLWAASGFAAGWLTATRPVSALALAAVAVAAWIARPPAKPLQAFGAALAGASIPLALLVLHQAAVTGSWLTSVQSRYYELADGPPGCFRYGFGAGTGCWIEHGSYVRDVLPDGYGLFAALRTTARRLHYHLTDIANAAPFAALVPLGGWIARANRRLHALALMPLALLAAYAPFYFDGSYPGGGARLLSEAIAFEHVLVACAVLACAHRIGRRKPLPFTTTATSVAVAMLLGFAFQASHQHLALRDRDGGRPMFERSVLEATLGPHPRGLLFVDSDHGFHLAFDPRVRDASQGLVVARLRRDDRDRWLWSQLGRPPAWIYSFPLVPAQPSAPSIAAWIPPAALDKTWRFEAEAEWPVLNQSGGYAGPVHRAEGCVSGGQALGLVPTGTGPACATIELPLPGAGPWTVRAWLVTEHETHATVRVQDTLATASKRDPSDSPCLALAPVRVDASGTPNPSMQVCTRGSWVGLDRVDVWPAHAGND